MNWNFITQLEKIEKYLEENGIEPVSVTSFGQTWPGTCLGFSGAGENTLTNSQTTIIESYAYDNVVLHVFFDGAIAYHVVNPNEQFYKDMFGQRMCPVWDKHKYEDDNDFVNDILSDVMITNEQVEDVRSMTRIEAIKYLKTNVQGIDNIQHAAIFYDTCIKHCL